MKINRDLDAERDWIAQLIWETSRADEGTISVTGANIIANALMANDFGDISMLMADLTAAWETIERVENLIGYGIGVRLDPHEGGGIRIMISQDALEDALWGDHGNE